MMGSGAAFSAKEFKEYRHIDVVNGVKVLVRVTSDNASQNTPMFSHTPNTIYARVNQCGDVVQYTVYRNNKKVKDIDWSHNHGKYKTGEIHVQEYNKTRMTEARDPTVEERELAEILMKKNYGEKPWVKKRREMKEDTSTTQ